jgi:hypothetical protein
LSYNSPNQPTWNLEKIRAHCGLPKCQSTSIAMGQVQWWCFCCRTYVYIRTYVFSSGDSQTTSTTECSVQSEDMKFCFDSNRLKNLHGRLCVRAHRLSSPSELTVWGRRAYYKYVLPLAGQYFFSRAFWGGLVLGNSLLTGHILMIRGTQ